MRIVLLILGYVFIAGIVAVVADALDCDEELSIVLGMFFPLAIPCTLLCLVFCAPKLLIAAVREFRCRRK